MSDRPEGLSTKARYWFDKMRLEQIARKAVERQRDELADEVDRLSAALAAAERDAKTQRTAKEAALRLLGDATEGDTGA